VDDELPLRLGRWLEGAAPLIFGRDRLDALAAALREGRDCLTASRWGGIIGYDPEPPRRRLVEFDRRGHLIAALAWRDDGALVRAKCFTANGQWVGIEPAEASHPAWGLSDGLCLLDPTEPWTPRERITIFQALDYARPDVVPALAEPRRLPPGTGTAVLNLVASVMKDAGFARVRYRGPYPTEQLFTALLESFRYDPTTAEPLERFMAGEPLDWLPAPHERHHVAPGLCVQLRHEIDKVSVGGTTFYRTDWQEVARRESRVVRREGQRFVCALWAFGRPVENRLVLDSSGEVLEIAPTRADARPPAPLAPVWTAALADLVARESAPALAASIAEALSGLNLEWGAVPGDLLRVDGGEVRISRALRDAGLDWLGDALPGEERTARAIQFALEVARLLGPVVRTRAQMVLENASEDEQRRALLEAAPEPPLSASVGRLLAGLVSGRA
jgi:hypothetical protein